MIAKNCCEHSSNAKRGAHLILRVLAKKKLLREGIK